VSLNRTTITIYSQKLLIKAMIGQYYRLSPALELPELPGLKLSSVNGDVAATGDGSKSTYIMIHTMDSGASGDDLCTNYGT
jgi:hypothetical protein